MIMTPATICDAAGGERFRDHGGGLGTGDARRSLGPPSVEQRMRQLSTTTKKGGGDCLRKPFRLLGSVSRRLGRLHCNVAGRKEILLQ